MRAVCRVRSLLVFALGFAVGEIACLVLMFALLPITHAGHKEWR